MACEFILYVPPPVAVPVPVGDTAVLMVAVAGSNMAVYVPLVLEDTVKV